MGRNCPDLPLAHLGSHLQDVLCHYELQERGDGQAYNEPGHQFGQWRQGQERQAPNQSHFVSCLQGTAYYRWSPPTCHPLSLSVQMYHCKLLMSFIHQGTTKQYWKLSPYIRDFPKAFHRGCHPLWLPMQTEGIYLLASCSSLHSSHFLDMEWMWVKSWITEKSGHVRPSWRYHKNGMNWYFYYFPSRYSIWSEERISGKM